MNNTDVTEEATVTEKIIHTLTVYPLISPTMLQGGLGPYMKPDVWRPILDKLIHTGVVIQEHVPFKTPYGRHNSYTRLYLAKKPE